MKNSFKEWEDELENQQAFSSILHCEGESDEMKAINFMVFASENDLIKYDVEEKEVVWKIPIPAASSMTSPVMDAWWRILVRFRNCIFLKLCYDSRAKTSHLFL